jgi:type II secretory pathway pseudopilin PulG
MAFHLQMRRAGRGSRRDERGHVLLILLLAMAMMIIFAAAIVPTLKFEIERDREEELIHRGTQYSRAIRAYYKRFGRYPAKLEDLESANNMRFLRKRYKDPTNCAGGTCKDFKLLHFGEVKLTLMMGIPGAQSIGSPGTPLPAGAIGQANGAGGNAAIAGQVAALAASGSFGTNTNSLFPNNQGAGQTGSDSSATGGNGSNSPGSDNSGGNSGGGTGENPGVLGTGPVFGGGPVVGVASTNKKDTIREFNHKKKYNEWQFYYDPGADRGALLTTPNQPLLQPFGQQGLQNVNGQNGNGQNGGTTPTGLQNNPNPPGNGQPASPSDPNNPAPPQ